MASIYHTFEARSLVVFVRCLQPSSSHPCLTHKLLLKEVHLCQAMLALPSVQNVPSRLYSTLNCFNSMPMGSTGPWLPLHASLCPSEPHTSLSFELKAVARNSKELSPRRRAMSLVPTWMIHGITSVT